MKRTLAVMAALIGGTISFANADVPLSPLDVPANPLVTPWSRPLPTYKIIGPGLPTTDEDGVSVAVSNVIYLNNCKPNGCQVFPGPENAATGSSGIPEQSSVVTPFAYDDNTWNQVVECVKDTYAPFGVNIVTERPATGSYHMAIVAGRPQDVQMQNGVGGVSPFSCGYINNSISYSFSNIYGGDVNDICWTVAQETAHSWGLDHKYDNRDPMTYMQSGPARKTFQDSAGPCGEFSARSCQCGGNTMNSYQEILATFGGSTPTPPTVDITSPKDGDTVNVGFAVRADIKDDLSPSKAELRIDGVLVGTLTYATPSQVWTWNAPSNLSQGTHTVKVTGYDVGQTPTEDSIKVTIGKACGKPADCPLDTDTCIDGRCAPGSGVQGGLGNTCANNTECASGQCAGDSSGNSYCVEGCDVDDDGCPSGFGCIEAGGQGVCWPGGDDGGGCTTQGDPRGVVLLGIGFAVVLVVRRRRRR
ncbi:MAG: Ig-like domain-containing protein [Kofleriaceae bacterium]